ncbi:VWA domain-containing protein [Ruminococcus bicirculans (ex Wegman et al. 2014)]|uniref:vWA domain-containing protein n=1 Tax=Ruminococcus bicirculans (ex Wegman et al. 2014) TaxID=1160721 RepID=UPI003999BF4C
MFKTKTKARLKRMLSGALALAMTASAAAVMPASAEETAKYPYAVFAADEDAGITVNTDSFTLNGNAYTNGVFSTTAQYPNINGTVTDADDITDVDNTEEETEDVFDVNKDMILIHTKLTSKYFTEGCDTYDEDYTYSDMNVNINDPIYVTGRLNLDGNISLNDAVGAVSDVDLTGGNLNGNNTVIYSKFGDIDISNSQATVNGLIYAPFGTVTIDCDNFNMNGLIIAQNVVIDGYGANINYSSSWAELVGTESEELSWTMDDWQYLADTDEDGLPNLIEKEIGSDPYNPDTDGDGLPDGYEALTLGTDPTKPDTDDNGVLDCDEDFDEDGLTNLQEYELGTEPYNDDTDGDGLNDGEEINTYITDPLKVDTDDDGLEDGDEIYFETDPLNPDTDGNGVLDGDEKRFQTFIHKVENEDCAVTEVRVSMEGTGNLQKATTVESIMNKDILCSEVVGLVGEPFEIKTTSQFDKATLTYVIDKSKLGDTEFDNLLFLWYDEENDNFVELDTVLDEDNSTVSVETTHFSKYMLVDKVEWFNAWKKASLYFEDTYEPLATVICYDCSGSMSSNDRTFNYNIYNEDGTIAYSYPTCYRKLAIDNYIDSMTLTDKTALISYESSAKLVSGFSNDKDMLKSAVKPYNSGGTNAQAAVKIAIDELESVEHWYTRHIILLSDGDVNISEEYIQKAQDKKIKIHTIGLGYGASNSRLKSYAESTGGQFFAAATAEELEAIYNDLSRDNHFDLQNMEDLDGDGLPDEFEVSGLVVSNAQIFYTDPENPDCDGDGLLDGEEIYIDYSQTKIVVKKDSRGGNAEYSTVVFSYKSDPWNEDTDWDKLTDLEDKSPTQFNELKNYFIAYDREDKKLYEQALWMIENEYNNQNCEIYYLHTINDFINCWNNEIPSSVKSIHLYLHGVAEYDNIAHIPTDPTIITNGHLALHDPALQFYNEVMKPTPNSFEGLKAKYVEKKVYLNACNGGTEDDYGMSVAKRISEKITNHTPVEALKNGYVNYLSEFDYEISNIPKSPFDKLIMIYETIGQPPIETSIQVSRWKNYNLYPRRSKTGGTWIEITSEKINDSFIYYEKEIGDDWEL